MGLHQVPTQRIQHRSPTNQHLSGSGSNRDQRCLSTAAKRKEANNSTFCESSLSRRRRNQQSPTPTQCLPQHKHEVRAKTRNIVFGFNNLGYSIIEQYGNSNFYCFDDLGVEPEGKHFGKDCNVMGEILLSRHEIFTKCPLKHRTRAMTHITSNLNAEEIEDRYGNRVRSRLREMVNVIGFDKNTKDKRK